MNQNNRKKCIVVISTTDCQRFVLTAERFKRNTHTTRGDFQWNRDIEHFEGKTRSILDGCNGNLLDFRLTRKMMEKLRDLNKNRVYV